MAGDDGLTRTATSLFCIVRHSEGLSPSHRRAWSSEVHLHGRCRPEFLFRSFSPHRSQPACLRSATRRFGCREFRAGSPAAP
ncbi:hypothetical protein [Azospirillum palustre]